MLEDTEQEQTLDQRTREVLDFDEVLDQIARRATSELGRRFVLEIKPATEIEAVRARLAPMAELIRLLAEEHLVPLGGLFDAGELIRRASIHGGSLDVGDWPRMLVFLEVSAAVAEFRGNVSEKAPIIAERLRELEGNEELQLRISRTFDPSGDIRDDASRELSTIRRSLRSAEQRLHRMVGKLVIALHERGILQENFSTVRNGRHVFPVKSNQRGKLSGILHGASSTGETVFVEPSEVVEGSNEIEELHERERQEIHRILRELTRELQPWLPAAAANLELLEWLDGVTAIARTANELGWNIPIINQDAPIRLYKAHHPLLSLQSQVRSVPVTMMLDRGDHCLVLSGPNAGGKTTTMKMLGLLALLLQCGSPIPVFPDSTLPIFDRILADIGDQQDLQQGISTFSGHLRRIKSLYELSGQNSLVLLDELGTGTDPQEGGALALAILEGLAQRAGLTITTSHLNPVKQWAEDTDGARNASFSLDPNTGQPTFRLRLDIPGASEAFALAEQEQFPPALLVRARELAGKKQLEMGELLRRIEGREQALGVAQREAEARTASLAQQEELVRARAEMLRNERLEQRERALKERERTIAELRERIEKQIATLPGEEELRQRKERLSGLRDEMLGEQRGAATERTLLRRTRELQTEKLKPGNSIYVPQIGQWGEVISVTDDFKKARVAVGVMEVSVKVEDLLEEDPRQRQEEVRAKADDIAIKSGSKKVRKKKRKGSIREALRSVDEDTSTARRGLPANVNFRGGVNVNAAGPSGITIDLHGYRVEEALAEVDRFLDRSLLANYPHVKICHGTGTGKLYRAIHEYLRDHPAVRKFRFGSSEEGGGGITIVEL